MRAALRRRARASIRLTAVTSFASFALAALVPLVALVPRPARAAEPADRAIHGDAYVGYASFSRGGEGPTLGLDALARWKVLQAGLLAEGWSGRVETSQGYGLMLGVGWYRLRAVGFDLVGALGLRAYQHVSADLATNGASATLPFAQLRGGVNVVALRPFSFGAWLFYGDDLRRATKLYDVTSSAPGGATVSRAVAVGEPSWGVSLRVGVDLPL